MSYVAKTYEFIEKVEKVFNKKMFKVVFVLVAAMVFFFGTMNAYAQLDETKGTVDLTQEVTVSGDYSAMTEFVNLANGTDPKEVNKGTGGITDLGVATYTTVAILAPSLTPGAEAIQNSETIPEDMKNGLIGFTDIAINYAYNNFPTINVYDHLAQEWIPGYDESTTSTYAARSEATQNGYDELMDSGIAPLWGTIRNIAYVFFVVIMIIVGFMIMFRSKIGGQTLVSLGNFLPGLITSLVLITFSFAIAGLLIDIGAVVTSLIAGIYGTDNVFGINSIGEMMKGLITGEVTNVENVAGATAGGSALITAIVQFGIGGAFAATAAPIAAGVGIIALLVILLIIGIVFVGAIKVVITLYKAYFGILLGVIVGPIQIMIGSFPGKSYSTSNWFKSLVKNVLTFPMVFAIVNLPTYLANQTGMTLSLPGKLSYAATDTNVDINSGLFMFVVRVIVLYFAAEAPKYLEAWFPSDTPKPVQEGFANAKASLSKVPLVGGLFK